MSLEEALKMTRFENEFEKAFVNVIFTSNQITSENSRRFKAYGLSPEQYNVLRILRGSQPKPLSLSDISGRMLDRNSNATRLVDKLILKDYASKHGCPSDKRQLDIAITQKGLTVLTELDLTGQQYFNSFDHFSIEEARELNRLLDKFRN